MGAGKVHSLVTEIEALSEAERQELAHEVLPLLLTTRAVLDTQILLRGALVGSPSSFPIRS